MKVKVCGLTVSENIQAADLLGADYLGFIYYSKSKRFSSILKEDIEACRAKKVGVFVNSPLSDVLEQINKSALDVIQLHGEESVQYCKELRKYNQEVELIKAIPIQDKRSLKQVEPYLDVANYLLFDTACLSRGGSGMKFDWTILDEYKGTLPFFLSGGLDVEDVMCLKKWKHPFLYGVDINSRFEIKPGVKDINVLNTFIKKLRYE